jgi:hypothetical protein
MANWCYNIIQFTGDNNKLENLQTLFEQMAEKETETNEAQLPPFINEDTDYLYLFDIRWEGRTLYYATKWSPNIDLIQIIADTYQVGFVYTYSEIGNGIYGEVLYRDEVLTDIYLESEDFAQYSYSEETDNYTFEGDSYESDDEILEILLDRRKAISRLQDR